MLSLSSDSLLRATPKPQIWIVREFFNLNTLIDCKLYIEQSEGNEREGPNGGNLAVN